MDPTQRADLGQDTPPSLANAATYRLQELSHPKIPGRSDDHDGVRAEIRIGRLGGRHTDWLRWRWDITYHLAVEGPNGGVYDRRWHLSSVGGYTVTAWGAAIAAGRALRNRSPHLLAFDEDARGWEKKL